MELIAPITFGMARPVVSVWFDGVKSCAVALGRGNLLAWSDVSKLVVVAFRFREDSGMLPVVVGLGSFRE